MARDPEGLLEVVRVLAPSLVPRAIAWGAVAAASAVFLWMSPQSPLALQRADVLLGHGRALEAARIYDGVAEASPWPALREASLARSAVTWEVELDAPREARLRWERLLWYRPGRSETAELLARIGGLLVEEGQFADAAVRLREAHDLAPQAREAGERLAAAATAADHAKDRRLADALWKRLGKTHPEQVARAELARGTLALHRGETESALGAFRRAEGGTFDPDLAAAAALGATVCLSRLGDVPGALSTLEEADLPPGVAGPRQQALRSRVPAPP